MMVEKISIALKIFVSYPSYKSISHSVKAFPHNYTVSSYNGLTQLNQLVPLMLNSWQKTILSAWDEFLGILQN
jgi:dihydroorotase